MTDFVATQAAAWDDIWNRFRSNGPGSTVEATAPARDWLQRIITDYGITSMLDAPCGDQSWMSLVDLSGVKYTGWDVQPDVLAAAQQRCPDRDFKQVNILTARRLPKVDLIWSKDFLIHLPVDAAVRVVNKFRNSARFLAVTNHPGADNMLALPDCHDGRPGYWCAGRDLEAAPFTLTGRVDSVNEGHHVHVDQEVVLFDLDANR